MCLAAVAIAQSERFPWVLASNRDEFFGRPSEPLGWWVPPAPESAPAPPAAPSVAARVPVLSGRDLAAGGTWLGVTAGGRLALVTNVREPGRFDPAAPSRGTLVTDVLGAPAVDEAWLDAVLKVPRNGYNLLVFDGLQGGAGSAGLSGLWAGNHPPARRRFGAGVFALSNAALDTPWPKVKALKSRLLRALHTSPDGAALATALFAALADPTPAPDRDLPVTGVPLSRERALSPAFIRIAVPAADGPAAADAAPGVYGTRCSTLVIVEQRGAQRKLSVIERRFAVDGRIEGETAVEI